MQTVLEELIAQLVKIENKMNLPNYRESVDVCVRHHSFISLSHNSYLIH